MSRNNQGMNWISQHKRLAIYLRDGLACAYCGESLEQGATLTLDHVLAVIRGGTNDATNLVTSCTRCNLSKNDRKLSVFARAVAAYINHGVSTQEITKQVHKCRQRSLDRFLTLAKAMVAERGSASKALAGMKENNNR